MTWRQRYGTKFGNKRSEHNGITYHSKKEAGFAAELDLRLKTKDIKSWSRQEKISLDVNGYHITNYMIDFTVEHNDGRKEYIEVKGFETDVWRMKWKLFEALFSDLKDVILTVVK